LSTATSSARAYSSDFALSPIALYASLSTPSVAGSSDVAIACSPAAIAARHSCRAAASFSAAASSR